MPGCTGSGSTTSAQSFGYVAGTVRWSTCRSITTVSGHAEELVERRLAPAEPRNDGRQTRYRGHPVFVAQHATATCCRTCLARWHDIPAGRALDDAERGYVVEAICRWIVGQYAPTRRRDWIEDRCRDQLGGQVSHEAVEDQFELWLVRSGFLLSFVDSRDKSTTHDLGWSFVTRH